MLISISSSIFSNSLQSDLRGIEIDCPLSVETDRPGYNQTLEGLK